MKFLQKMASGYRIFGGIVLFICFSATYCYDWDELTPLDDYVWRDVEDDPYTYDVHAEHEGDGYVMYVLNMTSQRWMNESVVVEEDTIWRHWVTVVIPDDVRVTDTGLISIMNGYKNDSAPLPEDEKSQRLIKFSLDTGAVSAEVKNVPNQPTHFADDRIGRVEDQIIARTWRYYIEHIFYEPDVNLLLPMVRAARRAVDTMVEFSSEINPEIQITQILPTGRSKRGWTSWLLACVDQRVFALSPVVLDLLNWHPNLHHHWQAYGGWSWAFQPYKFEGVSRYINYTESFEIFEEHAIDPLAYNVRLADRPKHVTVATGDQFFLPDDSYYFWEELQGVKYMQVMENTDHSLDPHNDRFWINLGNFFMAAKYNMSALPDMEWIREEDELTGTLTLQLDRQPTYIRGWWADTTNLTVEVDENGDELHLRDFRMRTLTFDNPIWWEEVAVQDNGDNSYSLVFDQPEEGYRGFFMEMGFPGPVPNDPNFSELNFSTEIQIIPDVLPYPPCATEEECEGTLK